MISEVRKVGRTLEFFGAVPTDKAITQNSCRGEILAEYGVLLHDSAKEYRNQIIEFVEARDLTGQQLNATFHKSWDKVYNASELQLRLEQGLHYLSTYGVKFLESAWGVDLPIPMYLPNEAQGKIPKKITLKVIRGRDRQELIQKGLDILTSGVALKQETLEILFEALLDELECPLERLEQIFIPNAEARILLCDRLNKLPESPQDLFRYFFWKATGELLIIKNDTAIAKIKSSDYVLPRLTQEQGISLAASFNRQKPLWLAFKANPENCGTVNWLSKLSKKYHLPKKTPLLLQLTQQQQIFSPEQIEAAAREANSFQLVRTCNAVRCYQHPGARLYRIRNGSSWVADPERLPNVELLKSYETILIKVLREKIQKSAERRFGGTKIYLDSWANWALPTSEKKFLGNFPDGSQIDICNGLVGVYWSADVDIDIKFFSVSGAIGWDYAYRSPNRDILFSGDMTAPIEGLGASEFIYFEQGLPESQLVTLNLYSGAIGTEFSIIVGQQKVDRDRLQNKDIIVNPNEVKFSAPGSFSKKGLSLGLVEPTATGSRFTLACSAIGNASSAKEDEKSQKIREAIALQAATQLRIRDLFEICDRPEEADLDLSASKLGKDSLLLLLS